MTAASRSPSECAFLGARAEDVIAGRPALVGCPLDVSSTYRRGSAQAPAAIRVASDSIETYSPLLNADLEDSPFSDLGDVLLDGECVESALDTIQTVVSDLLAKGGIPLSLGGEHTITLPVVRALRKIHKDFFVLHLDAHSDLRDDYEGQRINHATVIRRVVEEVGPGRVIQLGVRAGTREEFAWMRDNGTLIQWDCRSEKIVMDSVGGLPVYLTLDLDVLDPSCLPGTGNPEPGGWFYGDMERLFRMLAHMRLVGADVVELNPLLDTSQAGAITAAKIVRELLLILGANSCESPGVDSARGA